MDQSEPAFHRCYVLYRQRLNKQCTDWHGRRRFLLTSAFSLPIAEIPDGIYEEEVTRNWIHVILRLAVPGKVSITQFTTTKYKQL